MSKIATIKTAIKTRLDNLVPGTLGEVVVDDFTKPILDRDIAKYPAAILTTPSTSIADPLTNNDNLREHTFEILVVMNGDDVTSATEVEDLTEALLDALDEDKTLGLAFVLGTSPSTSAPEALSKAGDQRLIVFTVTLRVRAAHDIGIT